MVKTDSSVVTMIISLYRNEVLFSTEAIERMSSGSRGKLNGVTIYNIKQKNRLPFFSFCQSPTLLKWVCRRRSYWSTALRQILVVKASMRAGKGAWHTLLDIFSSVLKLFRTESLVVDKQTITHVNHWYTRPASLTTGWDWQQLISRAICYSGSCLALELVRARSKRVHGFITTCVRRGVVEISRGW